MTEAVSAIDGVVASSGLEVLPGCEPPVEKRADVVCLKDRRGWFYRYSHLHEIDPAIRAGAEVKQGQRIGLIGKKGSSGGWTHLHFDIRALQPSGKWGVQDSYAFLWQAYREQYDPKVIAVARPISRVKAGEEGRAQRRPLLGQGRDQELRVAADRRHGRRWPHGETDIQNTRHI